MDNRTLVLRLPCRSMEAMFGLSNYLRQMGFDAIGASPSTNQYEVRVTVSDDTLNQGANIFAEMMFAAKIADEWLAVQPAEEA